MYDLLTATCWQDGPSKFVLEDQDGRSTSTVEIETRYVPVPVILEPRESINSKSSLTDHLLIYKCCSYVLVDQGTLRVDLLDGRDIAAADRGGIYYSRIESVQKLRTFL